MFHVDIHLIYTVDLRPQFITIYLIINIRIYLYFDYL